jgi:hypothetical protein
VLHNTHELQIKMIEWNLYGFPTTVLGFDGYPKSRNMISSGLSMLGDMDTLHTWAVSSRPEYGGRKYLTRVSSRTS